MYSILIHAVEHWTALYSNHATLRTTVGFVHVAGLVGGGGCAIAADRATLMAMRASAEARVEHLQSLRSTHRVVLAGLAAVFISGALLFAADVETYAVSSVFWIKMGLVTLLLLNGALVAYNEQLAAESPDIGWTRLRGAAIASLALWFLTTLAGTALPNLG